MSIVISKPQAISLLICDVHLIKTIFMETVVDPGIYLAIGMLAIVLGMTSYGVYIGFGPPSRRLEDPFDNHHHGEGGHSHSHSHGHGHSHGHSH